jgi:hypothetical protein
MKIAVVSVFDHKYSELAKFSVKNKQAYCKKHGYDFYYFDTTLDSTRPTNWSKILAIQKILETSNYDWIWWVDIDTLIMNFEYKLEFIIDNNYEMIFTKNSRSHLGTSSCFFKNTDLVKCFLLDSYQLEKPYLKNINVHEHGYEQQSFKLILENEQKYTSLIKFICQRICNSAYHVNDSDVQMHDINLNDLDDIYKIGDFVIHFCGISLDKKLSIFLNYLLPKNISVILLSSDEYTINLQKTLIDNKNYNINFYCPKIINKTNYLSFSSLINECVNEVDDEFMIFVNPKSTPNVEDIDTILKQLYLGFGFVTRINFGLFGTTKELFRNVGLLDERFIGAEFEDTDFFLRLKLHDIAVYADHDPSRYNDKTTFSEYNKIRGIGHTIFNQKWKIINDNVYISKKNTIYKKISTRHGTKINNIKYYWDDFKNSIKCEKNNVFITISNKNIIVEDNPDITNELKCELITLYININHTKDPRTNRFLNYPHLIHVEVNSDRYHEEPIYINILDVTDKRYYKKKSIGCITPGWWWRDGLDENKIYEIRLYFKDFMLYSTILKQDKSINLELSTFI